MKINLKKLELVMAKNCLQLSELSKKAKVSKAIFQKIGKENSNLRPATIGKIAKALDVDVTELIEQED